MKNIRSHDLRVAGNGEFMDWSFSLVHNHDNFGVECDEGLPSERQALAKSRQEVDLCVADPLATEFDRGDDQIKHDQCHVARIADGLGGRSSGVP
jgi:hypothetical protein